MLDRTCGLKADCATYPSEAAIRQGLRATAGVAFALLATDCQARHAPAVRWEQETCQMTVECVGKGSSHSASLTAQIGCSDALVHDTRASF